MKKEFYWKMYTEKSKEVTYKRDQILTTIRFQNLE
jgi:hypothetical protein